MLMNAVINLRKNHEGLFKLSAPD